MGTERIKVVTGTGTLFRNPVALQERSLESGEEDGSSNETDHSESPAELQDARKITRERRCGRTTPPPPPSPDKGLIAIGRDFSRLCWAEPGVVSIQIPLQTVSQEGSKVGREKILYRKWVLEQGEQTNRRTDEQTRNGRSQPAFSCAWPEFQSLH